MCTHSTPPPASQSNRDHQHKRLGPSHSTRGARSGHALLAALFPLPPLRLELPEGVYSEAPACWWSRRRWIAHNLALYDQHYTTLRRNQKVESVARATFEAYLDAESAGADYHTGRNSRISLGRLQTATRRQRSTVLRCRRLVRFFGTRTTIYTGRQRTLVERLDSYNRGDRGRGWASVSALHETTTLPVDNHLVEKLLDQEIGTPPERSEGSFPLSRGKRITQEKNEKARHVAHGKDTKRRAAPAFDQRAVKLASSIRRDERFPLWLRQIPGGRLTAAVTHKAVAGWDADDVLAAFDEHRIAGRQITDKPHSPAGWLVYILKQIPDDLPPARLDRAREVAIQEAEHAYWRRELEHMRQARINAAPMNAEARAIRNHLAARTHGKAATRARQTEYARRELQARHARGES